MHFGFIIVGVALGTLLFQNLSGVLLGAFLGYLYSSIMQINFRLKKISAQLEGGSVIVSKQEADKHRETDGCQQPEESLQADDSAEIQSPVAVPVMLRKVESNHPYILRDKSCYPQVQATDHNEEITFEQVKPLPGEAVTEAPSEMEKLLEEPLYRELVSRENNQVETEPVKVMQGPAESAKQWGHTVSVEQLKERFFMDESNMLLRALGWFASGNMMVRIGVVILFFGVAFMFKYIAQHVDIEVPISMRLVGVALIGWSMLILGWKMLAKRRMYGLALQGGGIGILYLTIYAAMRLFSVLEPGTALLLLIAVAALGAGLAVLSDALWLASLSFTGGFLAPVLASTGSGSHIALFSYYAVLNGGIFMIAWYKQWRLLNLIGFFFTFIIGLIWGYHYYQPVYLLSVEPFLVGFALAYLAITVLFVTRQPMEGKRYVDATLAFDVPVAFYLLQSQLVAGVEYGMSISTFIGGALYLLLAWWLHGDKREHVQLLARTFLIIGLSLLTLTIPLLFGELTTAVAWAIEGIAILWMGLKQQGIWTQRTGLLLQLIAGVLILNGVHHSAQELLLLNGATINALVIALTGFISSFLLYRRNPADERVRPLLLWSMLWWFGTFGVDFSHHLAEQEQLLAMLFQVALSLVLFERCSGYLKWPDLLLSSHLLLPLMSCVLAVQLVISTHPMQGWGAWVWPTALLTNLWLLRQRPFSAGDQRAIALFWFILIILVAELRFWMGVAITGAPIWKDMACILVPVLTIFILVYNRRLLAGLPKLFGRQLLTSGSLPLLVAISGWSFASDFIYSGDVAPLPYLPLINPVDICQLLALFALYGWYKRAGKRTWMNQQSFLWLLSSLGFLWINAMLVRTVHQWLDVPLAWALLMANPVMQYTFALSWVMEGVLLLWLGLKFAVAGVQRAGIMLQVIAALLVLNVNSHSAAALPLINIYTISGLIIAASAFVSALLLHRRGDDFRVSRLLVWSMLWWFGTFAGEFIFHFSVNEAALAMLLLVSLTLLVSERLALYLHWSALSLMAYLYLPFVYAVLIAQLLLETHPLQQWGLLVWPFALGTNFWLIGRMPEEGRSYRQTFTFWLWIAVAVAELRYWMALFMDVPHAGSTVWLDMICVMVPAVALLLVINGGRMEKRVRPLLLGYAIPPMLVVLLCWSVASIFLYSGDVAPVLYIPFLNPLDITQILFFYSFYAWFRVVEKEQLVVIRFLQHGFPWLVGGTLFLWFNGVLVRTDIQWYGTPFHFAALYNDILLQASLSILWSVAALLAMLLANRRGKRLLWFAGAALLAAVVLKLFVVELASSGTLARVISFIGVGGMLMLIGYFSPVPPEAEEKVAVAAEKE